MYFAIVRRPRPKKVNIKGTLFAPIHNTSNLVSLEWKFSEFFQYNDHLVSFLDWRWFFRFPWQHYSFSIWQTFNNDFDCISLYGMLWHNALPQLYRIVTSLLFHYKTRFKWRCGCHGYHFPNVNAFLMNLLALLFLEISY